jgi:metallo-beta-lactamase family protein
LESTYGDRLHVTEDPEAKLEAIIKDAIQNGSVVLIPSFAIGRTQELLYHIHALQDRKAIPRIPIFVDSPMANSSTLVYGGAVDEFDKEMKIELSEGHTPLKPDYVEFVRDSNQSKALNSRSGPMMIIAGSGMCTGGRIVHHLRHRLDDPSTVVLFAGYQAEGTLGRKLINREPEVRIHGVEVPVRARIEALGSLSAHADYSEILKWLEGFKTPPKVTFIVHGEPPAQASLKEKIEAKFGWNVVIPKWLESFDLP